MREERKARDYFLFFHCLNRQTTLSFLRLHSAMVENKIDLETDVLCAFLGAGPVASVGFRSFHYRSDIARYLL